VRKPEEREQKEVVLLPVQRSLLLRPAGRVAFSRGLLYDACAAGEFRRLSAHCSPRHFHRAPRTPKARAEAHFPESESPRQLRSLLISPALIPVQNMLAAAVPVSRQRLPASFSAV